LSYANIFYDLIKKGCRKAPIDYPRGSVRISWNWWTAGNPRIRKPDGPNFPKC